MDRRRFLQLGAAALAARAIKLPKPAPSGWGVVKWGEPPPWFERQVKLQRELNLCTNAVNSFYVYGIPYWVNDDLSSYTHQGLEREKLP